MGLDLIEFTMVVEEAFGLSIPDADAVNILTPRQLVAYLSSRLPRRSRLDIETVVRRLMAEELGILKFEWENEFVRDLGCD